MRLKNNILGNNAMGPRSYPTLRSMSLGICLLGAVVFGLINFRQASTGGYIDGTLLRVTREAALGVAEDSSRSASSSSSSSSSTLSMQDWRDASTRRCNAFVESITSFDQAALDQKEQLERSFFSQLALPSSNPSSTLPPSIQQQPYARCKNAFVDLGSNIGDSVGYFIDNALDICSPLWAVKNPKQKFNKEFPRPHLDVTTLEFQHTGNEANPLYGLLQRQAKGAVSESFCVYGMEGNPAFTERLHKLENFIRSIQPPPFQHVHIFTESVVTAQDGPTKLYLDKTSVKQNVRQIPDR